MMAPSGRDEGSSQPDRQGAGDDSAPGDIPGRFEILELMRLMGRYAPVIMLGGDEDGYGARWLLHGNEVQPGIARYLMEQGYLADDGATELGARKLILSAEGIRFRDEGFAWWDSLGPFEKLKIRIFG